MSTMFWFSKTAAAVTMAALIGWCGSAVCRATMTTTLLLSANTLSLNNGDAVSSWTDTTGHGYNATQSNPTYQPTYVTDALNSLPAVHFAGNPSSSSANFLTASFSPSFVNQPMTIFAVANILGNAAAPNATDYLFDGEYAGNRDALAVYNNKYGMYAGGADFVFSTTDWDSSWAIYEVYFNGASSMLYRDGVLLASGNAGGDGSWGLNIGARYTDDSGLNGDIAAFQVYSGTPTDAERNAIGFALAQEYDLPSDYTFVPEPSIILQLVAGGIVVAWRLRRGAGAR